MAAASAVAAASAAVSAAAVASAAASSALSVAAGWQAARARAAAEAPELARVVYDAGPGQNLRRLAVWLEEQDRLGRLSAPDPVAAAEMFTGMVLGHGHLRSVLGLPHPAIDDIPARAREAARRFVRAFAPQ